MDLDEMEEDQEAVEILKSSQYTKSQTRDKQTLGESP
jgi:hypothetical protein